MDLLNISVKEKEMEEQHFLQSNQRKSKRSIVGFPSSSHMFQAVISWGEIASYRERYFKYYNCAYRLSF